MTREEAVEVLKERYLTCVGIGLDNHANRVNEAIDMAIEALQEAQKHEANKDAVEVVRCKDCKHYSVEGETTRFGWCGYWNKPTDKMRYCSDGERREE